MKTFVLSCLVLFLFAFTGKQADPLQHLSGTEKKSTLRKIDNKSFKRGERLTYRIHYGFIDAAQATLEITDENRQVADRNTFHVVGVGISKGTMDAFFKVRDRYETYID